MNSLYNVNDCVITKTYKECIANSDYGFPEKYKTYCDRYGVIMSVCYDQARDEYVYDISITEDNGKIRVPTFYESEIAKALNSEDNVGNKESLSSLFEV